MVFQELWNGITRDGDALYHWTSGWQVQNVGSGEISNEGINEAKNNIQHAYTFIVPLIVKNTTYRNKKKYIFLS